MSAVALVLHHDSEELVLARLDDRERHVSERRLHAGPHRDVCGSLVGVAPLELLVEHATEQCRTLG